MSNNWRNWFLLVHILKHKRDWTFCSLTAVREVYAEAFFIVIYLTFIFNVCKTTLLDFAKVNVNCNLILRLISAGAIPVQQFHLSKSELCWFTGHFQPVHIGRQSRRTMAESSPSANRRFPPWIPTDIVPADGGRQRFLGAIFKWVCKDY